MINRPTKFNLQQEFTPNLGKCGAAVSCGKLLIPTEENLEAPQEFRLLPKDFIEDDVAVEIEISKEVKKEYSYKYPWTEKLETCLKRAYDSVVERLNTFKNVTESTTYHSTHTVAGV